MPQELPEGFTLDTGLPSGFTLDEPKKKDNFFERFGDDLKQRFGEQGAEIINRRVSGDQGVASTALQLVGKVAAGSIVDFIGEALISGGRGLSNITPDFLEDPLKESATKAGIALINTDLGQKGLEAAKNGIAEYSEFKTEHPVMAANIESLVNVGLLVAPVKGKPKPFTPKGLSKTGGRLERSAARATKQNRQGFVKELVTPEQSKRVRVDQTRRTGVEGPLKSKVVELSPAQKASAAEVFKIKSVSPRNTLQGNLNIISTEVTKEAARLEKGLRNLGKSSARPSLFAGRRGKYIKQEFDDALDEMLVKIAHPSVQGDASKALADMITGMKRIAGENPRTLSGLLKSRKEFDRWITEGKGKKFFDSDLHNALQNGVRATRQQVNEFIATRAPSKGVKKSLSKQHRLLSAMDDIAVKAASEENNMISRAFKNALKLLPFRGEFNQFMAAIMGVGGLGASARFAPMFTKLVGATGVVYVGGKAITHPGSRKGLAGLLRMIDEAAQKTTDPAVLRQFRADRVAIVELLKTSVEAAEESE